MVWLTEESRWLPVGHALRPKSVVECAFFEGLRVTLVERLRSCSSANPLLVDCPQLRNSPLTRRALDVFLAEMDRVQTTRALAKRLKCHHVYFAREFARATRMQPSEYLRLVRAGAALAYIVASDIPLSRIGLLVGFGSRATFSRVVSQVTGRSPRYWRSLWRRKHTAAA